jgi:hypothetical protein
MALRDNVRKPKARNEKARLLFLRMIKVRSTLHRLDSGHSRYANVTRQAHEEPFLASAACAEGTLGKGVTWQHESEHY